ncbi:MAG: helix-turn-helix transcriptional regulator [Dysosmobacter sp.]|uniref:helix-turn-helix domain-containing protein n=1 Tax=Dysosmobacter sp. TaxID=2591382 RepID=UPI00284443D4|nr:helix-turn-helix transcriptional regulator [Dysosmobacter sp.]MDR3983098.1 helix-turn-helix transcriptional regulator [Dysosmobacter sp.]
MLGEYLKKYRIENGLTQADLAGKLSISQNAISQYENGKRCPPISRIAKIAKVLGCSVGDIVSDSDT